MSVKRSCGAMDPVYATVIAGLLAVGVVRAGFALQNSFAEEEPREGSEIRMLGVREPLVWRLNEEREIVLEPPGVFRDDKNRPCEHAWAFKIELAAALSEEDR